LRRLIVLPDVLSYLLLYLLIVVGVAMPLMAAAGNDSIMGVQPVATWPDWEKFKVDFLAPDGRVVDVGSERSHTVSEGQAYAMFFALVAKDKSAFDRILHWTENNLAAGDFTQHLPSWLWGRADDGKWAVLDANSASDADLWIAYTLIEAGRIWNERRYLALGTVLAQRILREESVEIPGLGQTLLPGPVGFHPQPDYWRLNPSYVPLQLVRRLAAVQAEQPQWKGIVDSSIHLIMQTAPKGFAPDWVEYVAGQGFQADRQTRGESAYNAIRVYLWAGMLSPDEPMRERLLTNFVPLANFVQAHGFPPEKIGTVTGKVESNAGPAGFSYAVAPYLTSLGRETLAREQIYRAQEMVAKAPLGYYGIVLALFSSGWMEKRYTFAADGALSIP
jgi:endo-1,4-beta-D-glucanase Y